MSNLIIACIFIGIFVVGFILIFLLFREIQNQRKPSISQSKPKVQPQVSPPKKPSTSPSTRSQPKSASKVSSQSTQKQSVPIKLQQKLFRLVQGNQETANRLLNSLRTKYPDKPETWYWEKAILDLERDRA